MQRRHQAVTLLQATQGSPTFQRLTELTRESTERLKSIEALVPPSLRNTLKAGPIDGPVWCLLVNSSAAAAKIRQMLPAFEAHLRSQGSEITAIRLKVQTGRP